MVKKAKYRLERKINNTIEIRKYSSLILARVEGLGDSGFGILFSYISGNNQQRTKVSMTAPVVSEQKIPLTTPVISETGSLAFILPEDYTIDNTPVPLDEQVKILQVPERNVAVLRFSGRWSDSIFKKKGEKLLDALEKAGIQAIGQVFFMRYDRPYMPWFMRRNEAAVEVKQ